MEAVELEKEIDYEISWIKQKRHATKQFTDKPVGSQRCAYGYRNCNLGTKCPQQPALEICGGSWENAELAKLAYGSNFEQVSSAPVTIAPFTDTDLAKRARKIARVGGQRISQKNNFNTSWRTYLQNLPATMNNRLATT